jgi:CheY-like chemotaxis protein
MRMNEGAAMTEDMVKGRDNYSREPPADHPGVERPLRVLVIDDCPDATTMLKLLLELLGHQVRVAHAGQEGVEAVRSFLPDVVLCDLVMPGMGGGEVAEALRGDPATASARLVAMAASGQGEAFRHAPEDGFDAGLVKPIAPELLRRLLEYARPSPPR